MDSEFLALSAGFLLIGFAGIVLFNGPMTSIDSCACIISSPEPGAAQATSSILVAFGMLFLPIGVMKGGLPSFRRPAGPVSVGVQMPARPNQVPAPIASGRYFALGVLLVVLGVDAVLIPGYLVLQSLPIAGTGAAVAAFGVLAVLLGGRKPK